MILAVSFWANFPSPAGLRIWFLTLRYLLVDSLLVKGVYAMTLIVPIASRPLHVDVLRGVWNAAIPLTARLFQNNITPDEDTVLGDFTESDYAGYAAQVLTGWTSIGYDVDFRDVIQAALLNWEITSGTQDVYGLYVTNAGNTVLWWCERRAAGPIALDASTNPSFVLTPRFSGTSEF